MKKIFHLRDEIFLDVKQSGTSFNGETIETCSQNHKGNNAMIEHGN